MASDGYKFSFGRNQAEATPKFTSIQITPASSEMKKGSSGNKNSNLNSPEPQKKSRTKFRTSKQILPIKTQNYFEEKAQFRESKWNKFVSSSHKKDSKSIGFIREQIRNMKQSNDEVSQKAPKLFYSAPSTPNHQSFLEKFQNKEGIIIGGLAKLKNRKLNIKSAASLHKEEKGRNKTYFDIYQSRKQKKQSLHTIVSFRALESVETVHKKESIEKNFIKSIIPLQKMGFHSSKIASPRNQLPYSGTPKTPQPSTLTDKQLERLRLHFGMRIRNSKNMASNKLIKIQQRIKNLNKREEKQIY